MPSGGVVISVSPRKSVFNYKQECELSHLIKGKLIGQSICINFNLHNINSML